MIGQYMSLLNLHNDKRWSHENLQKYFSPVPGLQTPQLLKTINGYNIVSFKGMFFGIPQILGTIDLPGLSEGEIAALDGIIIKDSISAVQQAIESPDQQTVIKELAPNTPQLLKTINGYNIVSFKGMFFGIPQILGTIDLSGLSEGEIATLDGIIIKDSISAVQQAIENPDLAAKR